MLACTADTGCPVPICSHPRLMPQMQHLGASTAVREAVLNTPVVRP